MIAPTESERQDQVQQMQLNEPHEENAALRNANVDLLEENAALRNANVALRNANVALLEENAALRNVNAALLEKNQASSRPRARPRDELTVIAVGDALYDIHGADMRRKKPKRLKPSSPLANPATLPEASTSTTPIEAIDTTEV